MRRTYVIEIGCMVVSNKCLTSFVRLSSVSSSYSSPPWLGYRSRIFGLIVVARPKRCPQWAKRLYIRLTGSRAVTNRHTSEVQSPAPGTSRFEIEWDILEGRERSWELGFGSFFFVFGCLFCVSVVRSRLFVCTFWLHNLVFK
jgi:hypothetical protein